MIFKLEGSYHFSQWGGQFIPHWRKLKNAENRPYSAYFLGADSNPPAKVEFEGKWIELEQVLACAPELLGQNCREQFGDKLPFRLSVLDVKQPQSIRLHPSKKEAEFGFEQESEAGIALSSSQRIFQDRNHKPQILVALSEFWLLHGFKPLGDIQETLAEQASLAHLAKELEEHGLSDVYAKIVNAEQTQLIQWLQPIVDENREAYHQGKLKEEAPCYWLLHIVETQQLAPKAWDFGLLGIFLFNLVRLQKGEGLFQSAGLPYACLQGQCIAISAASDNAIFAGLGKITHKELLLHSIDYRQRSAHILTAQMDASGILSHYFCQDVQDFALQRLDFKPFDEEKFIANSATILLVISGSLYLDLGKDSLHLQQGEAVFISANSGVDFIGETDGYAMIATLPE